MNYRVGKKQNKVILDENGLEIAHFVRGEESLAQEVCNYLNSRGKEYIICAANWYKDLPLKKPELLEPRGFRPYNVDRGVVIGGWRHSNCLYIKGAITGLRDAECGEHVQGFLTNKNRFVDRKEGLIIALAANQVIDLDNVRGDRLHSEDLY